MPLISTDPFWVIRPSTVCPQRPRCQTKTVCSHFVKILCESVWCLKRPAKTCQVWAQRQAKVSFKMKWCLESVSGNLPSAFTVARKLGLKPTLTVTPTSCHVIVVCVKSNFIQRPRQWDSFTVTFFFIIISLPKASTICSDVHCLKGAFLFLSQPISCRWNHCWAIPDRDRCKGSSCHRWGW